MTIRNASLEIGSTWGPTGGNSVALSSLGQDLSTNKCYLSDGASSVLRKTVDFTTSQPKPLASAPNGTTQQRSTAVVRHPLLLDNGLYTTNTVRIEVSFDPEASDAEITRLLTDATSLLNDAELAAFWLKGSVD
jgi:hypothetical protein